MYMYVYIYMCVWVCIYVYIRYIKLTDQNVVLYNSTTYYVHR